MLLPIVSTACALRCQPAQCYAQGELLGWLAEMPGCEIGPVRFGDSMRGGGGGVFLSRAVEDKQLLFAVPLGAMITLQDAIDDPNVGDDLSLIYQDNNERAALSGFVAHL